VQILFLIFITYWIYS